MPAVQSCPTCKGFGRVEHTGCPMELVAPEVWEAVQLSAWMEDRVPPVAGGVLDQCHAFLEAHAEITRIKSELSDG